jgi:hypothetical protein
MARLMSIVVLAVVVAGLLLRADASAAAQRLTIGDWRAVSGAEGRVLTDDRYVVTRSDAGLVQMLDTATGIGRVLASPPCDNGPSLPSAVGSGMLVWECASLVALGGHVLVVDDLASGRRFIPQGLAQFQAFETTSADASRFHVLSAGRYWVYLTRIGYHFGDDVLVGFDRAPILHLPAQRADVTVDPDQPSGSRRLCAGIRRRSGDVEIGQLPFESLDYHRPYAITSAGRVRRCTGAPSIPRGQGVAALTARYLSWATDGFVRVRSTAGGRTARRAAPGTVRHIALTRRFVYITTGSGSHVRVYRARMRTR